jgi:hypothetical protein
MIDREKIVRRNNPVLYKIDTESPFTVGNGNFAFTADITGFQTLYDEYKEFPLCVMSNSGWHSYPGFFCYDDVKKTVYTSGGKVYEYAVERFPETGEAYDWLRQNPHRMNLARIRLFWDGKEINGGDITDIRQELDLFTGVLYSNYKISGHQVNVRTVCAANADVVGFSVKCGENRLSVYAEYPQGSHKKSGSDWGKPHRRPPHFCVPAHGQESLTFTLDLSSDNTKTYTFDEIYLSSVQFWKGFWQNAGIADFGKALDSRAAELERRMVLSMYLTAVNCSGNLPPAETGLSCNSWYGKFHLEMHILHAGWFPLWNRGELLENSFGWYRGILDKAKENAARNGFAGARWPKMVGPEGTDCPSRIATLLIWQQPHILYMLKLTGLALQNWDIVKETADFMCGFAVLGGDGYYHLPPPLIPAQEEHNPENVYDPAFELSYWRFGLEIAMESAKLLGKDCAAWENVLGKLADPPIHNGLYQAHKNCLDTFASYNRDHPSMLFGYGFIPNHRINRQIMNNTVDEVLSKWDWDSAWGWDFALTAMTLTRLGRPDDAINILLSGADKNSYVVSGNNYQRGRDDLPLYLPGNGSLLFALSMMLAGFGETRDTPGFPKNGMWDVEFDGISPLPY